MLMLKSSVKLQGVSPELVLGLCVCESVFHKYNIDLVITSLTDSKHSPNSLHYSGNAADLRISNIPESVRPEIFSDLKNNLSTHFDVILESDHIHIEYQPRFL